MRKRDWLEIRIAPSQPKRIISRISVGETRLTGYGWDGGEHVGVLRFREGYIYYGVGPERAYLKIPDIRNGQVLELEGPLAAMILNVTDRKKLLGE